MAKTNEPSKQEQINSGEAQSRLNAAMQHNLQTLAKLQANYLETLPELSGLAFRTGLAKAYAGMFEAMRERPEDVAKLQSDYLQGLLQVWGNFLHAMGGEQPAPPIIEPERGDRRFTSPEWDSNPLFSFMKQSYLLTSKLMTQLPQQFSIQGKDPDGQKKLDFHIKQWADMLAPSNHPATNPDVLAQTLETKGQNLADGLANLVRDIQLGRMTMTDTTKYAVGENLAVTEGAVVYENELCQVIQYSPSTDKVWETPLLIIPPWINKFYILDLQPHNSLVKHLVDEGHTVFMVSWRNPHEGMDGTTWEDYMRMGALESFDAVLKATGQKQLNLVGYCIGGTLTSCVLSHLDQQKGTSPIKSVTYLTAMSNFSEAGDITVFIDREQLEEREREYGDGGNFHGNVMANAFAFLRANDLVWNYWVNNYLKGNDYQPFDLLYWNSDPTNMPGAMYLYYLRNFYLENNLMQPGKLKLLGTPMDLRQIKTPTISIATQQDHIAPWKTVYGGFQQMGEAVKGMQKEFVLGASGHIAGVVNPPAKKKRQFWFAGDQSQDPEGWFASAKNEQGSWWPYWFKWLEAYRGKAVAARTELGGGALKPIEPAPGRYVTEPVEVSGYTV